MDYIVKAIDEEIARLQQARTLLAKNSGSANYAAPAKSSQDRSGKKRISAAGRARIAAAQRKRWAAKKKAASKVPF